MRRSQLVRPIALLSCFLFAAAGCGPTFYSAKGTIASSGGQLDPWSATPIACSRDEFDGDSSKLITMTFRPPVSNDPDRNLHRDTAPDFPIQLHIAKNGPGLMGVLDTRKLMEGLPLDSSNCKTLTLNRKERSASMGDFHPTLDGELVLDCTVKQSHITGDVTFKKCGM